jgi:sulfotransferase 6B1
MQIWQTVRTKSNLVRKSASFANRAPRAWARARASREAFRQQPVLLGNSIPKSGTHLLMQILDGLPGARNFGTFIAQAPSISLRPRTDDRLASLLGQAVPGEVVGAHLTYAPALAGAFAPINACHFFIYRDPRDIIVSNAHYMQAMNPWNRLHRYAARHLPSLEDKITALICGLPAARAGFRFGDLRERLEPFAPWVSEPSTCAVRFEDLVGEGRLATIERMVGHFAARAETPLDRREVVATAMASIMPERSHTFRSGSTGDWRQHLTDRHKAMVKDIAGDLLIRLGYERSLDW